MTERKCRCGEPLKPLFHGDALAGWYCPKCKDCMERDLDKFFREIDANLLKSLETVFPKALAHVITNLLTFNGAKGDAQQPRNPGDPAAAALREGR